VPDSIEVLPLPLTSADVVAEKKEALRDLSPKPSTKPANSTSTALRNSSAISLKERKSGTASHGLARPKPKEPSKS